MSRTIVHVDMDAFFAAIEQRDNQEFQGKPVIVGADPRRGRGRGVVAAASYEARSFGIHSAMPISKAWRLCPHGVYVRPRFERYTFVSSQIMELLRSYSPLVEPVSIDEAYLDVTGCERLIGSPEDIGRSIRKSIFEETGMTASAGIADCKYLAKIASEAGKPSGLTVIAPGGGAAFLSPLPLRKLWGIGPRMAARLESIGLRRVGELAAREDHWLEQKLGPRGPELRRLALGLDDRPVMPEWTRRSISEERTFEKDIDDPDRLEWALLGLADDLGRRMRHEAVSGRTVTLKIRLTGFETFTRSSTLSEHTNGTATIHAAALELFRAFDRQGKAVRLLGIGLSNLDNGSMRSPRQLDLFSSAGSGVRARNEKYDTVLDQLRDRFGDSVARASLLRI